MTVQNIHALEYISRAEKYPPRPVAAICGNDLLLRRQAQFKMRGEVLGGDDGYFSFTTFDGDEAELRDVLDELATLAMFGGGKRMVVVEDAGDFVSSYRQQLEEYVSKPCRASVLVLDLDSFPANTRLYKIVAAEGLIINCDTPSERELAKWLADQAKKRHNLLLSLDAAELLVELTGSEMGLLDQELDKLAIALGDVKRATPELVRMHVGNWRTKTVWDMLDAALDGNVPEAMRQLDRLLASGEHPVGILAAISASLRRFAAATAFVLQAEAAGRKIPVSQALEQAGVKSFIKHKAEQQIRKLGRHQGAKLYKWLLETDLGLKGESSMPPRLVLEELLLRLAVKPQSLGIGP